MRITEVEIFDVKLAPRVTTWNPVITRINADEGISGIGEVALAYGMGSAAGLGMVRNLAEHFLMALTLFALSIYGTRCTFRPSGPRVAGLWPSVA